MFDNDNWLYQGTEDAWLNYSYSDTEPEAPVTSAEVNWLTNTYYETELSDSGEPEDSITTNTANNTQSSSDTLTEAQMYLLDIFNRLQLFDPKGIHALLEYQEKNLVRGLTNQTLLLYNKANKQRKTQMSRLIQIAEECLTSNNTNMNLYNLLNSSSAQDLTDLKNYLENKGYTVDDTDLQNGLVSLMESLIG